LVRLDHVKVRTGQDSSGHGQVSPSQGRSKSDQVGQDMSCQCQIKFKSGQARSYHRRVRSKSNQDQVRSCQVSLSTDHARSSCQIRSGQVRSGQIKSGQNQIKVMSCQVKSGQGQVRTGRVIVRSGQVRPRPDHVYVMSCQGLVRSYQDRGKS